MNILEKRDDAAIKKRLLAGLKDGTFHPMPIHIRDERAEPLELFITRLRKEYEKRNNEKMGEEIIKRIKEQTKILGQEYVNDLKTVNYNDVTSEDKTVKERAYFLMELSLLLSDRNIDATS